MLGYKVNFRALLVTIITISLVCLLAIIVDNKNTEVKSIEVYNANGNLLSTLEGTIHLGRDIYIILEDDTVMIPNSNFTYIEKELVD